MCCLMSKCAVLLSTSSIILEFVFNYSCHNRSPVERGYAKFLSELRPMLSNISESQALHFGDAYLQIKYA